MKQYQIIIQPNPRRPLHFRAEAGIRQFNLNADGSITYEFTGVGKASRHYWSWSPRFWFNILKAWFRPVPEELEI